MLSALSDVDQKVTCLELGASDYLQKPFALKELIARVRARLRQPAAPPTPRALEAGALRLDFLRRAVDGGGGPIGLSEREFLVLQHLMRREGEVCSREELLADVWGYSFDPGATWSTCTSDASGRSWARGSSRRFVMSGIGSWLRSHTVEVAWAAFAAANVAVIFLMSRWETIPFHFVWVSLALVYGFRVWGVRATAAVLAVVMAVTGAALTLSITRGNHEIDELAEVPLMAAMFVAMVWHARRRQAAMHQVSRMAESEVRRLERDREFIRDASHELRTPVTVARGHAELDPGGGSGDQVTRDADIILDELAQLSRISERLLILAAAEHASFLRLGDVPLDDVIESSAERWSAAAPRTWAFEAGAVGA